MKLSLRSSVLKDDYGITSLCNALFFLWEKEVFEDILIEELMRFYLYKVECRERKSIVKWFYDKNMDFPFVLEYKKGKSVNASFVTRVLLEKGCILTAIYHKYHFVLVTAMDEDFVYVFDPFLEENGDIYNRKIPKSTFFHGLERDGSLGPILERECLSFTRKVQIFDYEKH